MIDRRCVLSILSLAAVSGCARYRFGQSTLFRTDIQTVHVPVVRIDSFRDELGPMFTEVLQKRIEARTPYKLADVSTADSTFICRITHDTKTVRTETITDEVRAADIGFAIETAWLDRFGNVLMENRFLPPGETAFYFSDQSLLVPEGGQSLATTYLQVMERLADAVVDQMEARW